MISSGTCLARLFDSDHETTIDAVGAAAQTVLSVARAQSIEVGASVTVQLNDGSYHEAGAVTSRDLLAETITITTALATEAGPGARVMTKLGATVTLAAYGTPALTTTDWGFEGTIEGTHADLTPGLSVRIEIHLDSSGLELLEVLRQRVAVGF